MKPTLIRAPFATSNGYRTTLVTPYAIQFVDGDTYEACHLNARLWCQIAGLSFDTGVVLACDADH